MDEYLEFAKSLASQAGKIIKSGLSEIQTIEIKSDNSPVTKYDKQVNELVASAIKRRFPDHSFIGEEGSFGPLSAKYVWICDPIDGTNSFMLGMPSCLFVLGLFKEGQQQLAICYNPSTQELYEATSGSGALLNNRPIKVNEQTAADNGIIVIDAKAYSEIPELLNKLEGKGYQVVAVNTSAAKMMLVAHGRAVGQLRTNGAVHDIGVAALIVQEAGGVVTDMDGGPLLDENYALNNGFIAGNRYFHQQALEIYQQGAGQ